MPSDPSDPWEPWDSPPAPRRQARDRRAADRRRTRVTVGVAVAALALVGGTALAVNWPDDDGSEAAAAASASQVTGSEATSPLSTGVGMPSESVPPRADGLPPGPQGPPASIPGPPPPATPPNSAPQPGPGAPDARPLTGRTVVIDPGHNPGNSRHTTEIGHQVEAGGFRKNCDETGTETNNGYTEAEFTLDVANRTRQVLVALGAEVVFTWEGDRPWGPCVDERARVGNDAHADAVVSIHGDGATSSGTGYHVIVPAKVQGGGSDTGPILVPSRALGDALALAFAQSTGAKPSNYVGQNGIDVRDDLGGLNLSTVPKVFIECGNMRNAGDAGRMTDPVWRQKAAQGIAFGIRDFLMKGT
ncbi:N-acetylmuramoyl-L-alanine amidase family protein [Yinghuangia sp. YIM S09857]|uniref:N-acetylmuramoyl-L-alanine amidase family protein n=1 Tax=Yinghuangia sp. YIM S09857 TaxID=3436929 RepID=UPI003F52B443